MKKLNISQLYEVTVERVLPFGVFVRLPNGMRGYIRRRELDLDADAEPSQVTHKGDKIKAVVLSLGKSGKDIELSRRATLRDPWPEFAQNYRVGDTVRCTVRAIRPHGIFVRIQAGIDGFIPLEELPLVSMGKPEEVFWVGDIIEAVITRIQSQRKLISLSINVRIAQYDQALEASGTIAQRQPIKVPKVTITYKETATQKVETSMAEKVGTILVVEDDDHVRDSLTTWLKRKGFHVSAVASVPQAMTMQPNLYKILIVDLHLIEGDGLELIQKLRKKNAKANVCVMSSPEMLAQRANDIEIAQVVEVFPKPLELTDIEGFLFKIASGERVPHWRADYQTQETLSHPVIYRFSEAQTLARLQHAMTEITTTIRAQTGLLFQLDPDSQSVSIPIKAGKGEINTSAIYGLMESPINDVIQDGLPVFEKRVTEKAFARFDKLFSLLKFESCIGVPIIVQGEVHHAAFFFHSDIDAFPHSRLRDAQAGALLLSAILTEENIQARIQSLNPMLLSGELAASFGHDVFNKITALELETRNLADNIETDDGLSSMKLLELVLDLKDTAQAFQQMLRTKEQKEVADGNLIVQRATLLLQDLVRKERAQIVLKLTNDIPSVMGNSILIQQSFLNIMLNAIQQMSLKAERLRWIGKRTLEITSLLKGGYLQIRFKDNGPGIHKESVQKIFFPGFSTRGGSGLGLYIARNFIQMLGGTLIVEETFVPLGTTFLVELPLAKIGDNK